ncbi:hypothetical protein ACJX0J_031298 [Zea mays]
MTTYIIYRDAYAEIEISFTLFSHKENSIERLHLYMEEYTVQIETLKDLETVWTITPWANWVAKYKTPTLGVVDFHKRIGDPILRVIAPSKNTVIQGRSCIKLTL